MKAIKTQVVELKLTLKTGRVNAVDVNVAHFDSLEGKINMLPKRLNQVYERIAYYNRLLAKKRTCNGKAEGTKSKRYAKVRTKLQRAYAKSNHTVFD